MREYFFTVDELPDLSLAKYSGLDSTGASGVISRHNAFLKQLHTIGELQQTSFHIYYAFNPEKDKGSRLTIAILCRVGDKSVKQEGTQEDEAKQLKSLLNSTALGEFYSFNLCNENPLPQKKYSFQSFLARSVTLKNSSDSMIFEKFFGVSKWKCNDSSRLYNVLKLLQQINTDIVYRVDLFPVSYSEKIQADLLPHMNMLRGRAAFKSSASGGALGTTVLRDENADAAYRRLKDFCEDISESVHFLANITALSNDSAIGRIILEYAASEIVTEGAFESAYNNGSFDNSANMDIESSALILKNNLDLEKFENLRYVSQLYTVDEIKGFFSLPVLFDNENIEMRKESDPFLSSGDIKIGEDKNGYPVFIPLSLFTKHTYISGVPGSGKTYTMKHLITSLWIDNGIPLLIFEPAKQEYRGLYEMNNEIMGKMILFSPGANTHFPLFINPFEVPQGITVSEHITNIVNVFEGAFDLPSPLPFLLNSAIEQAYTEHGWEFSDYGGRNFHSFPMMGEVYKNVEYILEHSSYGAENMGNLKAMLQTRIGSLLSREKGDVFDIPLSTLEPKLWTKKAILIELEGLGEDTANFLTLLISTIIRETIKAEPVVEGKTLRHVVFFEEAHNLIGTTAEVSKDSPDAKASSTKFIVKMLAEVRALKEGIVIADQLPSSIAPQVLKNTGFKLAHRQMSAEERQLLGQVMSADSFQLENLAKFSGGRALMMYEGGSGSDNILKPFEVQVKTKYKFSSDTPDNERLNEMLKSNSQRVKITILNLKALITKEIFIIRSFGKYVDFVNKNSTLSAEQLREKGLFVTIKQAMLECLDNQRKLKRCKDIYAKLLSDISNDFSSISEQQLKGFTDCKRQLDEKLIPKYNKMVEELQGIYNRAHNSGEV